MSKTIREWFEELPEPYRTQALKNASVDKLGEESESLAKALFIAFVWMETREGLDYWDVLWLRAVTGESFEGTPDLATLVRAFLAAKDELVREILDKGGSGYDAAEEKLETAEKALREAVGL